MRAADDGWAARFSAFLVAWSLFRFDNESQLQPIAANASRWATQKRITFEENASEELHTMHPYKYSRILQFFLGASCALS